MLKKHGLLWSEYGLIDTEHFSFSDFFMIVASYFIIRMTNQEVKKVTDGAVPVQNLISSHVKYYVVN